MAHIAAVNDPDVETFPAVTTPGATTPGATAPGAHASGGIRMSRPGRTDTRRARAFAAVAAVVLACTLAACSTGNDAAVYGGSFSFVSPGGQTEFSYPPDERGTVADLSGQNLVGDGTLALSDYAGKVVVLNFWGSWCAPCRGEAPELEQAAAALAPLGVQFLGVNVKDTKSDGADFVTSKQVSYPSIYDPSMRTLLAIRGSRPPPSRRRS